MYNDGRAATPVYIYITCVWLSVYLSVYFFPFFLTFLFENTIRSSSCITDLSHYPSIHKLWYDCTLLPLLFFHTPFENRSTKPTKYTLRFLSLFHCKMFNSWVLYSLGCNVCEGLRMRSVYATQIFNKT